MPVHHAESIPEIALRSLGNSKESACEAQLCLFFLLLMSTALLLLLKKKHLSNQPRLGLIPTVKLGWTNLFLPFLWERRRSGDIGLGPPSRPPSLPRSLPSCVCMLRARYLQMNTHQVRTGGERPLVARALVMIVLRMTGENHQGSASSGLMAHKDMAPYAKGRTNHVQTSAKLPE